MRVAHEMAGEKAEIQGVELYDIIQERPYSPSSASATGGKNAVVGGKIGRPLEITIREMLSDAKYFAVVKAGKKKPRLG